MSKTCRVVIEMDPPSGSPPRSRRWPPMSGRCWAAAVMGQTRQASRRCSPGRAVAGPGAGGRGLRGHRQASRCCGCPAPARPSSTCPRSCRRGCGSTPPARAARPMTPTPTPSPWSGSRMAGLRHVASDENLEVLRLLAARRRRIGADHTRMVCQLHALLLELLPGGAKKDLLGRPGPQTAGGRPASGRGREDAQARRAGTRGRPRAGLRAQEGREQGARRPDQTDRHPAVDLMASAPPAPPGCWPGSVTSPGSRPRVTSRPGPAPPRSTPPPATTSVTACPAAGTARSTWLFT